MAKKGTSDSSDSSATAVAELPKPFEHIRSGDIVWWWNRGETNNKPAAAIVVMNRGQGNFCLTAFLPGGPVTMDGVKHREDPALNAHQKNRNGCWAERE